MSQANSIGKNAFFMMGSQVITWISSFVLMLFLPRCLGSADFGRLYFAISYTTIFRIFIDFGGRYFVTKEIAKSYENASDIIWNSVVIRILFWLVSIVAMIGFAYAVGYSAVYKDLILILGVSIMMDSISEIMRNGFQGFEKMEYIALSNIVQKVSLSIIAVIALIYFNAHSVTIAFIMAISSLLTLIVSASCIPKVVAFHASIKWKTITALIKKGFPYLLWSIFGVIYYRIDAIMLSLLVPEKVVGWYGAAYRFFDIMMFVPSIFAMVVFPVFSRTWNDDKQNFERIKQKSLEIIVLAAIPICIGIIIYSSSIIDLFFGLSQYSGTTPVLKIFAFGIIPVYIDFVLGSIVLATDKQRQWSITAFLAVLVNIGLNAIFIPFSQSHFGNGGLGAGTATVITEFFVMSAAVYILPKSLFKDFKVKVLLIGVVSGVIMIAVLLLLRKVGLYWILTGGIGVIIYFIGLVKFGAFSPSEIQLMREQVSIRHLREILIPQKETIE